MFSRIKTFAKNHWKKVVIGGVAVHVIGYGLKYASDKIIEYQEAQAKELFQRLTKQQHYQTVQENCETTFDSLLPSLRESILIELDAEGKASLLRIGSINKLGVWEELKVLAFTRVLVNIYGSSLLNVLVRVQLSVIGGYLYQESQAEERLNSMRNVNGVILSNHTAIDADLQRNYLSLAKFLIEDGMEKMSEFLYTRARELLAHVSLKATLSIRDVEQILWELIRSLKLETPEGEVGALTEGAGHPIKYPWKYIFPPDIQKAHGYFRNNNQTYRPYYVPPDMYERLMCDTFDLLDSDDVANILKSLEIQGVSNFLDQLAESFHALTVSLESNDDGSGDAGPSGHDQCNAGSRNDGDAGSISVHQKRDSVGSVDGSRGSESSHPEFPESMSVCSELDGKESVSSVEEIFEAERPDDQDLHRQEVLEVAPPDDHNIHHEDILSLARIIPLMNGITQEALTVNNPWIIMLSNSETIKTLGANVFESFSTHGC